MNLSEYFAQLPRGGKKVLAFRLGVTASYLSRLASGDRSITAERALQIEGATDGAVDRYALRPDLQWDSLRKGNDISKPKLLPTLNQKIPAHCGQGQPGTPSVHLSSAGVAR